jgi:T5SS/PEP-CTERM-associated repeat protein
LTVGSSGDGTLNVEAGGLVSNRDGIIGSLSGAMGVATVSSVGSQWNNSGDLTVGRNDDGTLNVVDGGRVSVRGTLTIDDDADGGSFVNMSTGGMLALFGEADDSISEFLDLADGTDAVRYWDKNSADWADITTATYGYDYTLIFQTSGELSGYTLLTVGIAGDFDKNEAVNGNDFLLWQRDPSVGPLTDWEANYGKDNLQAPGDFNFSGEVDGRDFLRWQRDMSVGLLSDWESNYGEPNPISAFTATVPEPDTCVLALAWLGLAMRRRRD